MTLKTKVIAGNITNLSDARYFAGMNVDCLVFPHNKVEASLFKEITGWINGPELGISVAANVDSFDLSGYDTNLLEASSELFISHVAVHKDQKWILKNAADNWNQCKEKLIANKDAIAFIHVTTADDQIIRAIREEFPIVMEVSSSEQLKQIDLASVDGIYISGSQEVSVGLKDFDSIAAILEFLEEE